MTSYPVMHKVSADEYNALAAIGFIAEKVDSTSNVGVTTTELVSSFIQFPTILNARYKVYLNSGYESSVAGDIGIVRMRLAANTSDVTGTILRTFKGGCDSASKGNPFSFVGQFVASATGTQTVVSTTLRSAGTGTLRQNANTSDMSIYWLVERMGN